MALTTTPSSEISLQQIATIGGSEGIVGAEISAYDPDTELLFVTSSSGLQIVDMSDPTAPTLQSVLDLTTAGFATTDITSVSVKNGIVAVAIPAATITDNGQVGFFDAATGTLLGSVTVGALPDMVTFDATGNYLLVANEGQSAGSENEPDSLPNPNGSVSVIDLSGGVGSATIRTLDFSDASITTAALEAMGVRINPNAPSAAADIEPEYISISGTKAFITLQENNAVAVINDITAPSAFTISDIQALGTKDHSLAGNGLDPSNRDGGINIATQPVNGLYMPDAIATYEVMGTTYYVTANEGDGRDVDESRIADVTLDPTVFPDAAALQDDAVLGRLKISNVDGDTDGDGDFDELYSFGGRSFSIYDENGDQVFDSGDHIPQVTALQTPTLFNANDGVASEFDERSDDKGAEPEGVTVATVGTNTYAFVGLERAGGGVMVYNITDPSNVDFVTYVRTDGDIAPEGLTFIAATDSPNNSDLLVVTNEVSNTVTVYQLGTFDLQITEIWPGQDGADLTEDWFEITNFGSVAWNSAFDAPLFYDDESADPMEATEITGISSIAPGESAIVVIGSAGDDTTFRSVWGPDVDLTNVQVGLTDGAGLGQGGDTVNLYVGDPMTSGSIVDSESYPDASAQSGVSYDVELGAFSTVDNAANAIATSATAGSSGMEPAIGSPGEIAPFTLELLHVTDQEATGATLADIPRLSAVLNALEAQDLGNDGLTDNTLRLSSGDAFIPGLFYDASEAVYGAGGIADVEIQNQLGFQAIALGNHEFDFGTEDLAALIDGSAGEGTVANGQILGSDFTGTAFPYLSTNLDVSTDANLAPLEVDGGEAPQGNVVTSSVVVDVNGEIIGIVGATTPTLGSISSPGGVTITPSPFGATPSAAEIDALAAKIQAEVNALLAADQSLNKVVLLAHMQQIGIEQELATRLENVDIIVAGGSNTRLFDDDDRIRAGDSDQGQYPLFITNAGGTQTAVVNTDGSYKYVGRLVIDFDAEGNIIPDSYDETVSGAYATDEQGVMDLGAAGLVDPEIQQIVDEIEAQIAATESNVFGISDVFLNGNRSGTGTADDTDGVRTQETNLGNLTADANLSAGQLIDATVSVSIKNGGGIRASIGETIVPPGGTGDPVRSANSEVLDSMGNVIKPEGGISENDIKSTLAFNNGLSLLTLTKGELVAVLEHGVSALPNVTGQFPQISGIEFSFDPDAAAGDRIQSAAIVDENGDVVSVLVRNGEIAGDANELIRVVTLNFLVEPNFDGDGNYIGGGDGYPFPNINDDPMVGEVGDPAVIARVNRVDLYDLDGDGTADETIDGDATFAFTGTEQDALAEYLDDNFGDAANAFAMDDTGPELDERIQNLDFRQDTILTVGDQRIIGTPGNDILRGDAGNDIIRSGAGNDVLAGYEGNDLLVGGAGNDRLFGGIGEDRLFGSAGNDRLDGGANDDRLFGGAGNDILVGRDGNDVMFGEAGNDRFFGGAGNDRMIGGAGNDRAFGNAGFDVFFVEGEQADYRIISRGNVTVVRDLDLSDGNTGTDVLIGVERLVFDDGAMGL